MAFRKSLKNTYVSPGTIGDAIRRCRELRNLSMQELGLKCGFPSSSADIRIAQYETNKRIPSEETLQKIAAALEMDVETFIYIGLMTDKRLLKVLFELERQYDLRPYCKDGVCGLRFDDRDENGLFKNNIYLELYMKAWYDMYKKCQIAYGDSEEEKKRKKTEYEIWKGEFPRQIEQGQIEKLRRFKEKQVLQDELDTMNEEDHADEKRLDLKKIVEIMKMKVLSSYKPIKRQSDLVSLLIDIMEEGLPVDTNIKNISVYNGIYDENYYTLFLVKYSDIHKISLCC